MRRENGAKENELQVLVHLRKPRLYRLVLLRIMQLTCSTDSVIQFLERLYPPLQVKLIVRGAEEREREGGRKGCKPRRGRRRTESKGVLSRNIRSGKVEEGYLFSAGDSSTERRDMPGNIAAANCKVSRVAKIFEQLIISTSGQLNKTNRRRATSPRNQKSGSPHFGIIESNGDRSVLRRQGRIRVRSCEVSEFKNIAREKEINDKRNCYDA